MRCGKIKRKNKILSLPDVSGLSEGEGTDTRLKKTNPFKILKGFLF
jgi:hypothetical protein